VAAPPLGSPCDGPVAYARDIKTLVKSSKWMKWKSGYNTYRGWTQLEYQNKRRNINQKDEEQRTTEEETEGPTSS